jgi:hypothetical protein
MDLSVESPFDGAVCGMCAVLHAAEESQDGLESVSVTVCARDSDY